MGRTGSTLQGRSSPVSLSASPAQGEPCGTEPGLA